jgi:sigma-B regulation protein RsbQ
VTSAATRNHITVHGRGARAMVMAHGFGGDQTMWRFVHHAFEDTHRVVLFDYVGAGASDGRAYDRVRYGSLNGYVQDLLDVLDTEQLQDVTFVGHSVSAMIGAAAAVQQPGRFAALVMIAPSPRYLNDPPGYVGGFERDDVRALLNMMEHNYAGWASYLAPVAMKNHHRPDLSAEIEAKFRALDPFIARQFAEVTFLSDSRALLPAITTPTLILQCTDDAIAPLAVGEYLAREIAGATLRVMSATGHCPHLSQPDETIALIRAFLDARQPQPA